MSVSKTDLETAFPKNGPWVIESHDQLVQLSIWRVDDGRYCFRSLARDPEGRHALISRGPDMLAEFSALASIEVRTHWERIGLGTAEECKVTPFFSALEEVSASRKGRVESDQEEQIVPSSEACFDPKHDFLQLPFAKLHLKVAECNLLPPLAKLAWGILIAWASLRNKRVISSDGRVGVIVVKRDLAKAAGASLGGIENAMKCLRDRGFLWWRPRPGAITGIPVFFLRNALADQRTIIKGTESNGSEAAGWGPKASPKKWEVIASENAHASPKNTEAPPQKTANASINNREAYIEEGEDTNEEGRGLKYGRW